MKLSPIFLNLHGWLLLSLNVAAFAQSPQTINFKLLEQAPFTVQGPQPSGLVAVSNATGEFPEQWFTQPIDHFSQDSPTFKQRFWVNKRHYVPGTNAPVIVIDAGETSGEDRLPFLDTGIANILSKATGGIGVVLEHRYVRNSQTFSSFLAHSHRFSTGTTVSRSQRSGVTGRSVLI